MAARSVITVTTGEAGSGKSYARCARFIVDRFLPDHDGVHWSNFPLGEVPEDHSYPPEFAGETFIDRMADAARKLHKIDEEDSRSRIQNIPEEELALWEAGHSGPWEFFEGKNLQDAHIAIDEIHNYVDPQGDAKLRKRWRQWLGEIRHQGATVEFLSQALAKVPIEIRREAGLHIEVKNTETERDPFFKISMADWYELRAGFITGNYRSNVMEQERRSAMGDGGKKWTDKRIFPLDPWYFRFYDSFSKPQMGGNKGKLSKKQFQRRSKIGLLFWFMGTNLPKVAPKLGLVLLIAWLSLGHLVGLGGGPWVMNHVMDRVKGYAEETTGKATAGLGVKKKEKPSTVMKEPPEEKPQINMNELRYQTPTEIKKAIVELRDELEQVEKENEQLRVLINRSSEIALITKDSITLRNGFSYAIGEEIDYGPHLGKKIKSINWRRRYAVLDDKTILRMGGNIGADAELLNQVTGKAN